MTSSTFALGMSFIMPGSTLPMFALLNPSITSAVVASSATPEFSRLKSSVAALPSPFTTLSFSSRTSLWALLSPMPLTLLILLMFSLKIAWRISSEVSVDSIILADATPIPDTLMSRRNSSRSSFVAKPKYNSSSSLM